jgi:hypothetical protein
MEPLELGLYAHLRPIRSAIAEFCARATAGAAGSRDPRDREAAICALAFCGSPFIPRTTVEAAAAELACLLALHHGRLRPLAKARPRALRRRLKAVGNWEDP